MNPEILFGIAVVPAIIGLVQVVKEAGLPVRFAPLAALGFGVLAALAQVYAGRWPWIEAAVLGISLGLSASGLYAGVKTTLSARSPASSEPSIVALRDVAVAGTAPPPDPTPSSPTHHA